MLIQADSLVFRAHGQWIAARAQTQVCLLKALGDGEEQVKLNCVGELLPAKEL